MRRVTFEPVEPRKKCSRGSPAHSRALTGPARRYAVACAASTEGPSLNQLLQERSVRGSLLQQRVFHADIQVEDAWLCLAEEEEVRLSLFKWTTTVTATSTSHDADCGGVWALPSMIHGQGHPNATGLLRVLGVGSEGAAGHAPHKPKIALVNVGDTALKHSVSRCERYLGRRVVGARAGPAGRCDKAQNNECGEGEDRTWWPAGLRQPSVWSLDRRNARFQRRRG